MSWARTTFASLRYPHFRIVWFGTLFAFLAFFMSTVVQSVVAFELAGTNRAVGGVVFAQGVAMALLGVVGGALADRWPKRRVVVICQMIIALVFAGLAVLVASPYLRIGHLAIGSLLIGATFALLGPARQAFVVEVVPEQARGNAVALTQVANTASRAGGPLLAGILLAWPLAEAAGAYAVMAVAYLFSAVVLVAVPASPRPEGKARPVFSEVAAGVRYVAGQSSLRLTIGCFFGVILIGFPHITLLPGFVENQLGVPAATISELYLVSAIGALAASLAVARFADSRHAFAIYSGMGLLFGAGLIALATSPGLMAARVWMVFVGAGSGGFQALNAAVLIRSAEPAYVGRVMALSMLGFGGFALMSLPIGLLADAVGERSTLVVEGLAVLAVVLGFGLALARDMRHARQTRA